MGRKRPTEEQDGARKLTRDDWVAAATKALATNGIEGVRVETIARALGVTKGSFYWHFKDRDDLCAEILEDWRRRCTSDLIDFVGTSEDPRERLHSLVRVPFEASVDDEPMRIALGLQLWARADPKVRSTLAEIDDLRVRMMSQLISACGIAGPEARARAVLLYTYMRGAMWLVRRDDHELQSLCEAVLIDSRMPAHDANVALLETTKDASE